MVFTRFRRPARTSRVPPLADRRRLRGLNGRRPAPPARGGGAGTPPRQPAWTPALHDEAAASARAAGHFAAASVVSSIPHDQVVNGAGDRRKGGILSGW